MNSRKMYTEEDLKKMKVTGKDGLRELVVREKIFTGISSLKKAQIIAKIIDSKWWSRNSADETDVPKKLTKKQMKDKLKAELKEIDSKLQEASTEPVVTEPVSTEPITVTEEPVSDEVAITEDPPTTTPPNTPPNTPKNTDLRDVLGSMFRDDFIDTLFERFNKK
jgi:hypothetical protein